MAKCYFKSAFLLLALTAEARAQFYDIFQGFQPYLESYQQTSRPATIRKPFEFSFFAPTQQTVRKPPDSHRNSTKPIRNESVKSWENNRKVSKTERTTRRNVEFATKNPLEATSKSSLPFYSFIDVPEREDGNRRFFKEPKTDSNKSVLPSNSQDTNKSKHKQPQRQDNRRKNQSTTTQVDNDYKSQSELESDAQDHRKDKRVPSYSHKTNLNDPNPYNRYETSSQPSIANDIKHPFHIGQNKNYENFNQDRRQNEWTTQTTHLRPVDNDRPTNSRRPTWSTQGQNENLPNNEHRRPTYDVNHSYDRPNNDRPNFNDHPNNGWTTQFVRPVGNENRPPITNKPPKYNQRPFQNPVTKPPYDDAISFPETDQTPEIIIGPDEDYMNNAERRRYIEISERMCDRYKDLNTEHLAAIPLLPSPEPVAVNVTSCVPTNVPLVVGGKVVSIEEFPHMAILGWTKIQGGGYSWKCGGSLVSEQYVLTAAHCAYQERDNSVISGPPRVVQLGSSFLDDAGAIVVKVSSTIRHPKYKLPSSYYDIAMLKLASRVTFSARIKPACLGIPPPPGQPIIATGWGRTEFGGEQSNELRSVSLPIWRMDDCWRSLGSSRKLPNGPSPDSQVCAGEVRGGKDTCQGDSGGPAQTQDGCAWRVVAVTSLGRACGAPRTPALYAIVQRAFVAAVAFGGR